MKYCYKQILLLIFVLSMSSFINIAINILNKEMVNSLSKSVALNTVTSLFIVLVIVYMLFYFLNLASRFLLTFGDNYFRLNVDEFFHKIFMIKSEQMPQENFFDTNFMDKYSFVERNTSKISSYIGNLLNLIFSNIGTIVGSISIFVVYEPWLILIAIIIAICSVFINSYVTQKEYELDKTQIKEQRQYDYYKSILSEKSFAKELRIYNFKDYIYEKWNAVFDKLRSEKLSLALKRTTLRNIQSFVYFGLRVIATIILLIGITESKYDVGVFVMLFGLINTCTGQINSLMQSIISGVYKDTKYLNDYYDFIMPITEDNIKVLKNKTLNIGNLPFGEFNELTAENISYTYPCSEKRAVDNVSFTLKKGEIVSILGYNGSGKTTLAKLLCGALYPQSGKVMLNGIPLSEVNSYNIYSYFGMAPQEFSRFSLPIREFVGIGRIEKMHDQVELNKAYRKAELNDFINKASQFRGNQTSIGI